MKINYIIENGNETFKKLFINYCKKEILKKKNFLTENEDYEEFGFDNDIGALGRFFPKEFFCKKLVTELDDFFPDCEIYSRNLILFGYIKGIYIDQEEELEDTSNNSAILLCSLFNNYFITENLNHLSKFNDVFFDFSSDFSNFGAVMATGSQDQIDEIAKEFTYLIENSSQYKQIIKQL